MYQNVSKIQIARIFGCVFSHKLLKNLPSKVLLFSGSKRKEVNYFLDELFEPLDRIRGNQIAENLALHFNNSALGIMSAPTASKMLI